MLGGTFGQVHYASTFPDLRGNTPNGVFGGAPYTAAFGNTDAVAGGATRYNSVYPGTRIGTAKLRLRMRANSTRINATFFGVAKGRAKIRPPSRTPNTRFGPMKSRSRPHALSRIPATRFGPMKARFRLHGIARGTNLRFGTVRVAFGGHTGALGAQTFGLTKMGTPEANGWSEVSTYFGNVNNWTSLGSVYN